ncbi:MAG TPA: DUF3168 domain-containing protein [Thermoguttaceae bacterium]|nr:DUF3168 domain-containing protein [Thermoguttaceae bacterium]
MNLEQAIHEHWADTPALEAVLPADRLTTGRTSSGVPPYATLVVRAIRSQLPTNQGPAAKEFSLRIDVWHHAYQDAKTIAGQIAEAFDGASLELNESDYLARVRHVADTIKQHPDGPWQWTLDFTATVCVPA